MHDPMVVAFSIRRPWPNRPRKAQRDRWKFRSGGHLSCFWVIAGREFYFPGLITVWHREPNGADALTVCGRDADGRRIDSWRWHVRHWRIQIHPAQTFRRWLLTRCEWCGGKSRNGSRVNVSHSWDGERSPWWRGERGLFHMDCSSVRSAWQTCTCPTPVLEHDGWGRCARCERFRGYGASMQWLINAERLRDAIPEGARDRAIYEAIVARTKAEVEVGATTDGDEKP